MMIVLDLILQGVGGQPNLELEARPIGDRLNTPIVLQERLASRQIDLADGILRLFDQELLQLIAADLLELAIGGLESPARVDGIGHRLPIPFFFIDILAEIFIEGVLNLRGDEFAGFFAGDFFRFGEIAAAKVGGVKLDSQAVGGELREAGRAILFVQKLVHGQLNLIVDHLQNANLAVAAVQDLLPVAVDPLALMVHHLVVFQKILADVEVAFFDLFLGFADLAGNHRAFDGLAFLHAQTGEDTRNPFAGKDAHQVVFER